MYEFYLFLTRSLDTNVLLKRVDETCCLEQVFLKERFIAGMKLGNNRKAKIIIDNVQKFAGKTMKFRL